VALSILQKTGYSAEKEGRDMSQRSPWMRVFSVPKLQKEIARLEGELARAQQRIKQIEQGANDGDDNA
jgi:hypothetical protein